MPIRESQAAEDLHHALVSSKRCVEIQGLHGCGGRCFAHLLQAPDRCLARGYILAYFNTVGCSYPKPETLNRGSCSSSALFSTPPLQHEPRESLQP